MARYIWHILSLHPYIVMSWGIDLETLESDEQSLEFHVQGFIFNGNVRITYIDGTDVFQVSFYNEDGSLKELINDVYLSDLVDILDRRIENDGKEDYKKKVGKWLSTI